METATSLDSSSSEDLDNLCIDHVIDDIDISESPRKPHFLDYDAVPPPGFEDNNSTSSINNKILSPTSSTSCNGGGCPGENVKLDKKYERDGEISDYELAASGVTKRELTPKHTISHSNNNNNHSNSNNFSNYNQKQTGARKKKHFLDENPIPPDYMLEKEREHRSLDRNFERQLHEFDSSNKYDRKHSLERESRFKKMKEPSYTLSRFIEGEIGSTFRGTWPTERPPENIINYSSMPLENVTNLGPKVECVYSLLSMLGSHDSVEMSKKFLELSRTTETCAALRRSGCIPLLVQMMHSDSDEGVRKRAAAALHNVVHCHPDDKAGRREAKVLRLIEQIMDYCNFLKTLLKSGGETIADDSDRHPLAAISSLMKVSFDEEHRHAMCQLGALQAIASLVHLDHAVHGPKPEDQCCNSLRRYALMALTNLTFGDGNNKALLCANKEFMEALVAQLDSAPDDLLQVTASVLRNLSWRADSNMKAVLNEIGTVTALAKAAMKNKNENTLKAILSALWNLSAHCSTNKAEFCAVDGALAFLVDMLTYEGPSKTLKIIENAGGILRNVSSHIAVREDYRKILRQRNCLGILLQQLKSESLTVVSNACGTLWNLSARCPEDQKYLWDNGAVPMLRSLIHSKHKMISEGSSAALKNLLNFRPGAFNQNNMDPIAKAMGLRELPTLNARKQRALEQELNRNLAETCDNLDVVTPPKEKKDFEISSNGSDGIDTNKNLVTIGTRLTRSAVVSKSESRDSILSAKSDSFFEKVRRGHSAPSPTHETVIPRDKSLGAFSLRNNFVVKREFDVEQVEQPIDYSAKYNNENVTVSQNNCKQLQEPASVNNGKITVTTEYQETDLDQPTDFSLRYAENQVESDAEEKVTTAATGTGASGSGNEIILILEDSVKCYQTEGTPYIISNAGSITDLRNPKSEEIIPAAKRVPTKSSEPVQNYGSGTYTPEKPINYCEEGTPGYFSRYESLSSLDESPPICNNNATSKVKPEVLTEEPSPEHKTTSAEESRPIATEIGKNVKRSSTPPLGKCERQKSSSSSTSAGVIISNSNRIAVNSAQETPLMFSRRSSMDSLASAEPITADDKSSVVSDFSRLASGVISPSELPDSPTQSMPQSPRRNSSGGGLTSSSQRMPSTAGPPSQRLRSVFEDETNTFLVENTPAQFSCATSLSNLSLEDEPKIVTDTVVAASIEIQSDTMTTKVKPSDINTKATVGSCAVSDGEEATNDDILLATCINIGMNKGTSSSAAEMNTKELAGNSKEITMGEDIVRQYYTEDTPALLSKVGSNSNLSALSMPSMTNNKTETAHLTDESSNTSEGGSDLLEQCIREGMQKTSISKQQNKMNRTSAAVPSTNLSQESQLSHTSVSVKDPIEMLRRGGLPPYLPVRDEMNKFLVEDSPCSFSLISGLSNLTVGSGVAGPANIKKMCGGDSDKRSTEILMNSERKQNVEDSLSSISIESEDDSNLLSQTIAAGCNKSMKNHLTNKTIEKNSVAMTSKHSRHHRTDINEANDSLSSVDSSDSNDYQAKSLFEQCIRTGMNKHSTRKVSKQTSTSVHPQVVNKQIISPKRSQLPTFAASAMNNIKTPIKVDRERQKERDRKDEQLLQECISTGIAKSVRSSEQHQTPPQIKPPIKHVRQILGPTDFSQRLVTGGVPKEIIKQQFPNITAIGVPTANIATTIATVSKNGETTSAAVLEQHPLVTITSQSAPNIAPGVEMREPPEGISTASKSHIIQHPVVDPLHQQTANIRAQQQNIIGSDLFETSQTSLNVSGEGSGFILDQSNEYPALKLSNIDSIEDSLDANESSFEMDVSNEFLIEKNQNDELVISENSNSKQIIHDKHKDPDLMLKSVERLTQELVSTAEYLRTANSSISNNSRERELASQDFDNNSSSVVYEKKSGAESNSNSNNTWNEDTCPNDISFPSVSVTAPMIASLNDDETTISDIIPPSSSSHRKEQIKDDQQQQFEDKTPTNEIKTFNNCKNYNKRDSVQYATFTLEEIEPGNSQPNSLETETDTLVNDETDGGSISSSNKNLNSIQNGGIQFKVGGEVQHHLSYTNFNQFTSSGPMSFDISSTLTNSTIIAMEADKIANDLLMQKMSDSTTSLDLDNIRPPSGMESLSISGCFDTPTPQSPQLSRLRKKSLPVGLVARRALAGGSNGQGQFLCISSGMSGSVESVNSSCNLDNIKPPSIMDELLDSMISVESITSEIVDNNSLGGGVNNMTITGTNYETAFSDVDENTTTLQSCMDGILPHDYDSNGGTPTIPSDFSSAESTPRKGQQRKMNANSSSNCIGTNIPGIKRVLTPKQKRKIIKDRYKTYTIAADFVLKEDYGASNTNDKDQVLQYSEEDDEIIRIEIEQEINDETNQSGQNETIVAIENKTVENSEPTLRSGNMSGSVKRRSTDPDRYKTRTIIYNSHNVDKDDGTVSKLPLPSFQGDIEQESLTSNDEDAEEMSSIRALTKQFKFINSPEPLPIMQQESPKKQTSVIPTINSLIRAKLLEEEKHTTATTTAESDYNSMECDQNSETESCGDQNCSSKPNQDDDDDDDNNHEISPNKTVINTQQVKPKIIKPNDKDSGTEINCSEDSMTPPETVKTVRGRKKPAYISPYKKSVLSNSSSRTTSPKSQIGNTVYRANLATKNVSPEIKKTLAGKNIPRNQTIVAKTHILVNKSNLMNKINVTTFKNTKIGKSTLTERNLINKTHLNDGITPKETPLNSKQSTTSETPAIPGSLERQGTFVKEEPSNIEVPIVSSLPSSPAKVSKLPTKLGASGKLSNIPKSPIKTVASTTPKMKSLKPVDSIKPKIQTKPSSVASISKMRSNMSNIAIPSSSEPSLKKKTTMMIIRRPASASVAPPQRSNSNASIRTTPSITSLRSDLPSTTPPSRSNSNLTGGGGSSNNIRPTGISSRIAGIWKKTEDSKKTGQQTVQKSKKIVGKPPVTGINKNKLTRSSTFDNSSTGKIDETTQHNKKDTNHQMVQRKTEISKCNTATFLIRRSKNQNIVKTAISTVTDEQTNFRYNGNSMRTETNC